MLSYMFCVFNVMKVMSELLLIKSFAHDRTTPEI